MDVDPESQCPDAVERPPSEIGEHQRTVLSKGIAVVLGGKVVDDAAVSVQPGPLAVVRQGGIERDGEDVPAPGPEYPPDLRVGGVRVGDVLQNVTRQYEVEGLVLEAKALEVLMLHAVDELSRRAPGAEVFARAIARHRGQCYMDGPARLRVEHGHPTGPGQSGERTRAYAIRKSSQNHRRHLSLTAR
jgi:hypothetical protein